MGVAARAGRGGEKILGLAAIALLTSCAGPQRQSWENTSPADVEDAFLVDDDFSCLKTGHQVGRSYFVNVRGHDQEMMVAAQSAEGGAYPVGTVVQLFPGEAMVKRHEGFSAETGDWEFLLMEERDGQTVITARGTTEVKNIAGTCAGCHAMAERFDYVCAEGHGCDPLPGFVLKMGARATERDSRCQ